MLSTPSLGITRSGLTLWTESMAIDFQLPLSGSPENHHSPAKYWVRQLSTPSLGITNGYWTCWGKRYRPVIFQLPLSGSRRLLVVTGTAPVGSAFNSLSRDHHPLSQFKLDEVWLVFLLSTPSLGITLRFGLPGPPRPKISKNLSTPSLGITISEAEARKLIETLTFNSLSRDHIQDLAAKYRLTGNLSTPSLGITEAKS